MVKICLEIINFLIFCSEKNKILARKKSAQIFEKFTQKNKKLPSHLVQPMLTHYVEKQMKRLERMKISIIKIFFSLFFQKQFWRKSFPIPLFYFYALDSPDSPLVRHLLTSQWHCQDLNLYDINCPRTRSKHPFNHEQFYNSFTKKFRDLARD